MMECSGESLRLNSKRRQQSRFDRTWDALILMANNEQLSTCTCPTPVRSCPWPLNEPRPFISTRSFPLHTLDFHPPSSFQFSSCSLRRDVESTARTIFARRGATDTCFPFHRIERARYPTLLECRRRLLTQCATPLDLLEHQRQQHLELSITTEGGSPTLLHNRLGSYSFI